jgi:hypothetical protein
MDAASALSSSPHADFKCAICWCACEHPATAACGAHTFCAACLMRWIHACNVAGTEPRCPQCSGPCQRRATDVRVHLDFASLLPPPPSRRRTVVSSTARGSAAATAAAVMFSWEVMLVGLFALALAWTVAVFASTTTDAFAALALDRAAKLRVLGGALLVAGALLLVALVAAIATAWRRVAVSAQRLAAQRASWKVLDETMPSMPSQGGGVVQWFRMVSVSLDDPEPMELVVYGLIAVISGALSVAIVMGLVTEIGSYA